MEILWLTAFIDRDESDHQEAIDFWQQVAATGLSERHGSAGEFVTLTPPDGDAHLRLQRTTDGRVGCHLDLHVDDVEEATAAALRSGAVITHRDRHVALHSPGEMEFCFVAPHGESAASAPDRHDPPRAIDQLCIDVPHQLWETECAFWAALLDRDLATGALPEYAWMTQLTGLPIRLLFQRLGEDDTRTSVTAHLDLACGDNIDAIAAEHVALGATIRLSGRYWTTLTDPTGVEYCLTMRDPYTGTIA